MRAGQSVEIAAGKDRWYSTAGLIKPLFASLHRVVQAWYHDIIPCTGKVRAIVRPRISTIPFETFDTAHGDLQHRERSINQQRQYEAHSERMAFVQRGSPKTSSKDQRHEWREVGASDLTEDELTFYASEGGQDCAKTDARQRGRSCQEPHDASTTPQRIKEAWLQAD